MKPIALLDASVVMQRALRMSFSKETERVITHFSPRVLDFTFIECANALRNNVSYAGLPKSEAVALSAIIQSNFKSFVANNYLIKALELAVQFNHPVYDALYIACAGEENIPFVTADKKLVKAFSQLEGFSCLTLQDLPERFV